MAVPRRLGIVVYCIVCLSTERQYYKIKQIQMNTINRTFIGDIGYQHSIDEVAWK